MMDARRYVCLLCLDEEDDMVAHRLRQPFRLEVATWTIIAVAAGLALGGCTAKYGVEKATLGIDYHSR